MPLKIRGVDDHMLLLVLKRKSWRLSIPIAKATADPAVSAATARATNRDCIDRNPLKDCRIGAEGRKPIKRFCTGLDLP
jgi:hypothetical protein